jgi:hypothetical protein
MADIGANWPDIEVIKRRLATKQDVINNNSWQTSHGLEDLSAIDKQQVADLAALIKYIEELEEAVHGAYGLLDEMGHEDGYPFPCECEACGARRWLASQLPPKEGNNG